MTTQGPDLSRVNAAMVAVSHPAILARMTKIVAPMKRDGLDTELLVGRARQWILWPHQLEILLALMTRRRVVILKARQLGVTWVMALYALWYVMAHPHAEVIIVSVGEREARAVVKRIRFLYDHLPEQVRAAFPVLNDTLESFPVGHPDGVSTITSLPSTATAGRGETANVVLMDEGAHWPQPDERMAALLPTFEDVGQGALASTANGVGGVFHDTFTDAETRGWFPMFHNALARPDRDEAWVKAARERLGDKGPQEYPMDPEEAFISSGSCVFDTQALQSIRKSTVRPPRGIYRIERDAGGAKFVRDEKGPWRVWGFRRAGADYLITGDVCGGPGSLDYSAAFVWDTWSWEIVATYHGKPDPENYARELMRAGYLYRGLAGPAMIAAEANNDGRSVITVLREQGYPAIWRMQQWDQRRDERAVQHGWLTTQRSRPIMLNALKASVVDGSVSIPDAMLIQEMFTFEKHPRTGREEAREGCHDDRVMGAAVGVAILSRESAQARRARPDDWAERTPYRAPTDSRTGY